jgi:hypothetical protein
MLQLAISKQAGSGLVPVTHFHLLKIYQREFLCTSYAQIMALISRLFTEEIIYILVIFLTPQT